MQVFPNRKWKHRQPETTQGFEVNNIIGQNVEELRVKYLIIPP
jgi:hypothetical protein